MSKKQYIHALNREIQKLNGVIDLKILHEVDYRSEAKRHRKLLAQIRKIETRRSVSRLVRLFRPAWL